MCSCVIGMLSVCVVVLLCSSMFSCGVVGSVMYVFSNSVFYVNYGVVVLFRLFVS